MIEYRNMRLIGNLQELYILIFGDGSEQQQELQQEQEQQHGKQD